jgi:hypothetical protein
VVIICPESPMRPAIDAVIDNGSAILGAQFYRERLESAEACRIGGGGGFLLRLSGGRLSGGRLSGGRLSGGRRSEWPQRSIDQNRSAVFAMHGGTCIWDRKENRMVIRKVGRVVGNPAFGTCMHMAMASKLEQRIPQTCVLVRQPATIGSNWRASEPSSCGTKSSTRRINSGRSGIHAQVPRQARRPPLTMNHSDVEKAMIHCVNGVNANSLPLPLIKEVKVKVMGEVWI